MSVDVLFPGNPTQCGPGMSMDGGLSLKTPFASHYGRHLVHGGQGGPRHIATCLRGPDSEWVAQVGISKLASLETLKWRPLVAGMVSSSSFGKMVAYVGRMDVGFVCLV